MINAKVRTVEVTPELLGIAEYQEVIWYFSCSESETITWPIPSRPSSYKEVGPWMDPGD